MSAFQNEQQLYTFEYRNFFPNLLTNETNVPFHLIERGGSRLEDFLYHMTMQSSLPTLLHLEDRNSMAFSIESRVPFLDHRLVEYAFTQTDDDKMRGGIGKKILRDSMTGILPDAIRERKDKKGFVTPGEVKWLRGCLSHLTETDFRNLDFINREKAKSIISDFKKGDNKNAAFVWRLVVLDYWLK